MSDVGAVAVNEISLKERERCREVDYVNAKRIPMSAENVVGRGVRSACKCYR